jgi:hypothetical protein
MMTDLMFVAALGALTIRVLTMIFGGLIVIGSFMLIWSICAGLVERLAPKQAED